MAAAIEPIVTTMASGTAGVRGEEREETIRVVEYSRFPRAAPQQNLRIGFTRDLCTAGMCLGVDECEPVGSLLRICVRDVDGHRANAFIGRVVWAQAERDRRFWLGVELLTEAPTWNPAIFPAGHDDGGVAIGRSRTS